jgi:hypothetical protein
MCLQTSSAAARVRAYPSAAYLDNEGAMFAQSQPLVPGFQATARAIVQRLGDSKTPRASPSKAGSTHFLASLEFAANFRASCRLDLLPFDY